MSREKKSKKPDRKSFRGEFSFINKDANNIGSKEHNAHVSWHVMNRYERWKRQERTKRLSTGAGPSQDVAQVSSDTGPALVTKESVRHARNSLTNTQLMAEDSLFATYPPSPWNIDNAEQSMLGSASIGISNQYDELVDTDLGCGNDLLTTAASVPQYDVDTVQGFQAFLEAVQYPPLISKILLYSAETIIPTLWPHEPNKYKWQYEISRSLEDLTAISLDSCYASAVLCYYATVMASISGDIDIASQACFFQSQAMSELQQRVRPQSGGYSIFTLKAILKLFSAETVLDNTSTARLHLKMLRNIVISEGGVILLDSWFRENLLSADCYFALKYETRPLFPVAEWTPGPLSQPWKTRLASARLTGDHTPTVDAAVDVVLKTIMIDLRELFRVQRYVNLYETSANDPLLRWRQLRKVDCLSRLADHQLSVKIYPHLFVRPKLQSAICAGIALLTAMVLGGPEPTRFDLKLTKDLRDRICIARDELEQESREISTTDSPDTSNVMYWLLCVGLLSERCHEFPAETGWFADEMRSVSEQLGLEVSADSLAITKQFLHSQALIEEIEAGRSKPRIGSLHGIYEACGMSWRLTEVSAES